MHNRSNDPLRPSYDYVRAFRVLVDGNERTKPSYFDPQLLTLFKDTHRTFEDIYEQHRD